MKASLVIVDIARCAELLERPERFCSEDRLIRCASLENAAARMQGLAAELALSYALSGDRFEPPDYRRDENGKPIIEGGYVSLSHSGNFAVCAYAPCPVGVDIEERRAVSPAAARRILTEAEFSEYSSGGDPDLALSRFVMKEAYLKLTGDGVFGGMNRIFERDGQVFRDGVRKGFSYRFGESFIGCAVTAEPCSFVTEYVK